MPALPPVTTYVLPLRSGMSVFGSNLLLGMLTIPKMSHGKCAFARWIFYSVLKLDRKMFLENHGLSTRLSQDMFVDYFLIGKIEAILTS